MFNIVIVGFIAIQIKKKYEVWKDSRQSEAVLDRQSSSNSLRSIRNRWNTVQFNPTIATIGQVILAILPFVLLVSARFYAQFSLEADEWLGTLAQTWNEITLICLSYIVIPWLFYVFKKDFQTFVHASLRNIF